MQRLSNVCFALNIHPYIEHSISMAHTSNEYMGNLFNRRAINTNSEYNVALNFAECNVENQQRIE